MFLLALGSVMCIIFCVMRSFSLALFGYSDGSIGAAIIAVILVHVVIALYVYAAWKEGSTKTD